ncbi:MAG: hypothetical protein H8E21_12755 [Gammaproteobacteria bacterium]|nr:hypothetical protein [Gammaproteobacteria bacterium]
MNLNERVTLLAQLDSGLYTDSGIQSSDHQTVGIDLDAGLMVVAQGESALSRQSIEILIDDMQLNLVPQEGNKQPANYRAKLCLQESLFNIHEYLLPRLSVNTASGLQQRVELGILQLAENTLLCSSLGALSCLRYRDNQLLELSNRSSTKGRLGRDKTIQPFILEQDLQVGDILLLAHEHFLKEISLEFIRLTLSRFSDNLEMALRQINTRHARNGASRKPELLLCRIDQLMVQKRGWFNSLRNR